MEQGKPHPAVFLKAAHQLGVDPSELMAFEDAVSGVKAAKSSGMKCIGIAQPDRASILLDAGADHVVPDFRSLSCSQLRDSCRRAQEQAPCPPSVNSRAV